MKIRRIISNPDDNGAPPIIIADLTHEEESALLSQILGAQVRTFREPDGRYRHVASARNPALDEWPDEIETVNEETKNN